MTDRYAELHCHSNFSFLDGSSHPEELAAEAARLGLDALALTDHDGLYGVVRLAQAARDVGVATVFGAELTLGLRKRQNGVPDPEGTHLVVLARDPDGYARLSRSIAEGQLTGSKGRPVYDLEALADAADGRWLVTTACRKGAVPAALTANGPTAAGRELDRLIEAFGRSNVVVEIWREDGPLDTARDDALVRLADTRRVEVIATSNAHYAGPSGQRVAAALAAIRSRCSLDEVDPWLPAGPSAHLHSAAEQARRFRRWPGVVERAGEIGRELAFDLRLIAPSLPPYPIPAGFVDEMAFLRHLTEQGASVRYGPRHAETVPGAWAQIDRELDIIERLGFPGYFLVVWDITQFCIRSDILCQGRGSAANSAVCFALGVTKADAVRMGLLFERFLSVERDGPPDIDIDIENGRREEVIQYVYETHGRLHAAQVANIITYRPRSAIREAAKALGHSQGAIDAWSKQLERDSQVDRAAAHSDVPENVVALARRLENFPRHLGIHSGGMVMCDRPVVEVCPVEWATMPGRTVLQWDKEDCAAAGLVKFDLLGLGMLSAVHHTIDLIRDHHGVTIDLAALPQEDEVYDLLCAADTVGVFQVESRAQMATLPRLKPRRFYDLVIEVALIRPGPIQGGSVHPYLRRRNGREAITCLHPMLENCLERTLGVPLFQEQLMEMAVIVAGFTPGEADRLRSAVGSKRSPERMEALRQRFYDGLSTNEINGDKADEIWGKMAAFSSFGFPESHSISFAYVVYESAWLKVRYPAAFLAGLLNSQPMGFWSPRTLIDDARRHGVEVRRADVQISLATATLEGDRDRPAVRLGLSSVRTLGEEAAERVAAGRPYADLEDLARRAELTQPQMEALATAGATEGLTCSGRRAALWAAGAVTASKPDRLPGLVVGVDAPDLSVMTETEEVVADLWATGVTTSTSLTELARADLDRRGVTVAGQLSTLADRARVVVAGIVTHRQRPETAGGVTFLSLEDETGLINVVVSVGCWQRYRKVAQAAAAMVVTGRIETADGSINVVAERIDALDLAAPTRSRDFS